MKLFVVSVVFLSRFAAADIEADFKSAEIIPGVLSAAPANILAVTYGDKVLEFSGELTPTQVKDTPPTIAWPFETSDFYTIALVDPDIPNRQDQSKGQGLSWLVMNVPGNDISFGDTLAVYLGAGPSKDTGLHRYIFVVYKQPGKIDVTAEPRLGNASVEGRLRFAIQQFADKYGLGSPVAANMFQTQYDDYVPILHKQIGLICILGLVTGDVESDFKSSELVPDLITTAPANLLTVMFKDKIVQFSGELTPTRVKDQPILSWPHEPAEFYTICMTDPDAPSRQEPIHRSFMNWLVVNVPGDDISRGDALATYVGVSPAKDSSLHRYALLVYKQTSKLDVSEEKRLAPVKEGRTSFSIQRFADKYGLGPPYAGNMFQAQYDYVPTLIQQIHG